MAKLLDLTRANNIAISLKAFNDFTFRSLAETIYDVDPDCIIINERVQFIPNLLLPTAKEIQAIKKYYGEDDELIPAESFFRQLVPIKRIDDKVEVLQAMSTFDEHVQEARAGFKTLQEVCGQIMRIAKRPSGTEAPWRRGCWRRPGCLLGIRPILLREVEFYVYLKNGQFTTNDHTAAGDSALS